MKKILLKVVIVVGALMLPCIASSASAEINSSASCEFSNHDGDVARQKAIDLIASTFVEESFQADNSKFEKLDRTINEWKRQNCKLADGRPTLNFLLFGFGKAYRSFDNWELTLKKVRALRKAHPNAAYAILAEAKYWVDYAWRARGSGFASSVTPEGWRLFRERLGNAEEVLIKNKEVGSTLPAWYELIAVIGTGLNRPIKEQDEYFIEGVKRYKTFLPLYIAKRNSLEPKWGGSWKAVDSFINWSKTTPKRQKVWLCILSYISACLTTC